MTRLLLLVGACVMTLGYSKCVFVDGEGRGSIGDDHPGAGDDFATSLVLRDSTGTATTSFVMGEPIRFDLEIGNLRNRTTTLRFPDAQIYDFYLFDADDRVLWRWSEDMAFAQVVTRLTFAPRATRSYTLTWNGVLADGTQLPAGQYRARGVIVADEFTGDPLDPGELGSRRVDFTVR
ncbi:MAG TPA: BsuPI-related putative proteinase inhibitor [Steroidobacteraceae bacterium]|nr:BsuPI-related putative proteinase inhibitor [Steroidobacteraceae bacterium]